MSKSSKNLPVHQMLVNIEEDSEVQQPDIYLASRGSPQKNSFKVNRNVQTAQMDVKKLLVAKHVNWIQLIW